MILIPSDEKVTDIYTYRKIQKKTDEQTESDTSRLYNYAEEKTEVQKHGQRETFNCF